MKLSATVALAAAGSLAAAQGHHHGRQHFHKRDDGVATSTVEKVETVYQLDGTPVPVAAVCAGIQDGQYKWADGSGPSGACATATSTSVAVQAAELIETSTSIASISSVSSTPPTTTSTSSTPTTTSTSSSPVATSSKTSSASTSSSTGTGVDATFPDGVLSCDTFPSDYGAVALDYHGLGGWSGIQYITWNSLETLIEDIVTAVSGESCTDGAMCSYQCPDGYLKAQWPSTQGSTGQSVGGLSCTGGLLYRTNSEYETLCVAGVPALSVENQLEDTVCICRTDYPGTESETLPTCVSPGETVSLANPDGSTYYKWEEEATSAQYYINPYGYDETEACVWGSSAIDYLGNWAPMNLGLGYTSSSGLTYASIFPNTPTTDSTLNYTVTFDGDVSTSCSWDPTTTSYTGGVTTGCTVSIPDGSSATLILSE